MYPRSTATLLALAMACALLWRAEVEWNGWTGLIWLSTPHYAVPVSVVAFLAWTLTTAVAPPTLPRRAALVGMGLLWAIVALPALECLLEVPYGRFAVLRSPLEAMVFLGWKISLLADIPLIAFGLGRVAGAALRWWTLPLSVAGFMAAIPLAMCSIAWLEPGWEVDELHAIKTGHAVLFAMVGLGLPWTTRAVPGSVATPRLPP